MKKYFLTIMIFVLPLTLLGQNQVEYIVTAPTLNMRSGPGTNFDVVLTLSQNDNVTLVKPSQNGWSFVDYNGAQGYVSSKYIEVDPYSGWEKVSIKTGDKPSCENIQPEFDKTLDNYLRINVGKNTDVVVKLMQKGSYGNDKCIRIAYIRSNESYDIENIPEGKYYLKIAYGKDFSEYKKEGQCLVKFLKNPLYEKGSEILDYNRVKKPDTHVGRDVYENWDIPSFELFLDVVTTEKSKDFKTNIINEAEFNK